MHLETWNICGDGISSNHERGEKVSEIKLYPRALFVPTDEANERGFGAPNPHHSTKFIGYFQQQLLGGLA